MQNFKNQLQFVSTYVKVDVLRLFRDKVAIFFVFFFPLVFLIIFGSIFKGADDVSFRVAVVNQSESQFSGQFVSQLQDNKVFKVDAEAAALPDAKQKLNRGQLDAIIVLPPAFGNPGQAGYPTGTAQIVYEQSNESAAGSLASVLDSVFTGINNELAPYTPPFNAQLSTETTEGLDRFDYTFSGLLGFTMLSLGVFGPTQVFPRLKSKGVLRRYKTTPLRVWQYFVGNVISNALVGVLAIGIMFAVATLFFDLQMRGNYLVFAVVGVLGVTMLFGIGLAVGGWAKNENQAAPLAQLIALPMMFLSGVFFPVFLMPDFLQRITAFIPLTPVIEANRLVLTENASLLDIAPQLGIIGAWIVVVYAIAFRVFSWE